ncbi:MAG: helix-turn-helix domain-containing protein [Clostridia bacterium]|nr:helix-turn-helix domain-containing protein [Clostridia bacterium]MBQ3505784.1 helix-turn-helix domain-containing protein [Clostridia bacterium]
MQIYVDSFASRIKILRKSQNWSQMDFADNLGINQTTVSKWELGKTLPDTAMLVKLSKFFDVSTDYLLGLSTLYYPDKIKFPLKNEKLNSEELQILTVFRALNAKNRIHVTAYAEIRLEEQEALKNKKR